MKIHNFLTKAIIPVAAMLLASCVADDLTDNKPSNSSKGKAMTFFAIMENNDSDATRTSLGEDGRTVSWSADDEIIVYNKNNSKSTSFTTSAGGQSVDFSSEEDISSNGVGNYYALYPNQKDASFDGNILTASLPAIQYSNKGTFDPSAQLMTAHTGATYFKFKNIVALIKITIKSGTNFKIGAIRFTSNSKDDYIAGGFKAAIDDYGAPTLNSYISETASSSVTLHKKVTDSDNDDGTVLDDGTYYIAILPRTFSAGFTISLEDIRSGNEKIYRRTRGTTYTINRSDIINMGTYDGDNLPSSGETIEDAIDLGLPSGTLWCTKNVGASSADTYGKYYAWAEDFAYGEAMTAPGLHSAGRYSEGTVKNIYSWYYYKYGHGRSLDQNNFRSEGINLNYGQLGKYNSCSDYDEDNLLDYKEELDLTDDPAYLENTKHIMPTNTQREELLTYCNITYTTYPYPNGSIYGFKLTSKVAGYTDKYIFIPAGGYYYYNTGDGDGPSPLRPRKTIRDGFLSSHEEFNPIWACIWTKTRASAAEKSYQAKCLDIKYDNDNGSIDTSNDQDDRSAARNIRPVIKK